MIVRLWGVLAGRRSRRLVFWVYALTLATLTHWPALAVDVPEVPRPDLFLHFGAFFGFGLLLIGTSYFGRVWHSGRNIGLCAVAGTVYGVVDEATQAIPALQRHATVEDALANVAGVLAASLAALVVSMNSWVREVVPEPVAPPGECPAQDT